MSSKHVDITSLSRAGGDASGSGGVVARDSVPSPSRRLLTRLGVPVGVALVTLCLLAYSARDALQRAIEVDVAPVVFRDSSSEEDGDSSSVLAASETVIAQGPGWIEPAPYAISVQALAEGVVSEVLALEGDLVSKGQVVARMIDDDARLGAARARAEVTLARAEASRAGAASLAARARAEELRDEVERKHSLVAAGGLSEGQFARLGLRLVAAEHEEQAALAAGLAADALIARAEAALHEAELRLSRMEVRSPADGVVLTRSVEPGTRVVMSGGGPGENSSPSLFRLYDPERLQVRVDVPLAESAKVVVGARAEMTTEALADRVFRGEVVRVLHQADIQRNTVEVKVSILEPSPALRPEMLARVRFFPRQSDDPGAGEHVARRGMAGVLLAPAETLFDAAGDTAMVWVVDRSSGRGAARATARRVTIGGREGEWVLVREGLRLGDRLILRPPSGLRESARVRVASSTD